jgi:phenylpropionate dioxygenase-like ring-hydroxylating dioxygenase large terminal subunit
VVVEIPLERYVDEGWLAHERRHLFNDTPLCLAHASELAERGSVVRFDATGVPLLLVRDTEGGLHGLLNTCRHRGMRLVEERACARRTLVCPYHGWTYALDGRLRHVPLAETFPGMDHGALDLVRIPVAERGGFIWGIPRPGARLDAAAWLGPIADDLRWLGIPDSVVYRRIECERACNWKLVIEAFLESYHIRVLHRDSIFPFFVDAQAVTDTIGPHIRSAVARRGIEDGPVWSDDPREVRDRIAYTHFVFPNTVLIFHPDYASAISLYPHAPGRTRWVHTMLVPAAKRADDWTPHWEKTLALMEGNVFQREDLYAAEGIQEGLSSGANPHVRFGTLEFQLATFHRSIEERLGC